MKRGAVRRSALGLALATVLIAGCATGMDKAGGHKAVAPVILTAVLPIGGETAGSYVAEQVRELSHGRLIIDVHEGWRGADPLTVEQDAIAAVAAGTFSIGIVPVRAWDEWGTSPFDALVAPGEIDSLGLESAVLASPIADEMLARLPGDAIRPLGLLSGPLYQVAGVSKVMSTVADFHGARLALTESRVADQSVRALGAVPVRSYLPDALPADPDGLVLAPDSVYSNGLDRLRPFLTTNVPLWPRSLAVFGNASVLDRLGGQAVALLRQAVRQAQQPVEESVAHRTADAMSAMCTTGRVTFVQVDPIAVAAIRQRFASVRVTLRGDTFTRRALDRIDAIKAGIAPQSASAPCSDVSAPTPASTPVMALDGVWEMVSTRAEQAAFGAAHGNEVSPDAVAECNFGTIRWVFGHGTYDETQQAGTTRTWATGTITVHGNQFTLHVTDGGGSGPDGECHQHPGDEWTWNWSIYRDRLTIRWPDPNTAVVDFPANYEVNSWLRVGDAPATVPTTH